MWLWVISWSLAADETEISLLKTFLNLFTHVCICKSWCSSFMLYCFYKFTPVVCLNPKRSSNALRSEEIREDLGGLNWLCRCAETLVHSSHSVLPTACQTCRNSGKKKKWNVVKDIKIIISNETWLSSLFPISIFPLSPLTLMNYSEVELTVSIYVSDI